MGILEGKKALIAGVASNRSIAYGVAKCMHREGAQLAFTYQTEKLKPRVEKFAKEFESDICIEMEVSSDDGISKAIVIAIQPEPVPISNINGLFTFFNSLIDISINISVSDLGIRTFLFTINGLP